MVQLVLASPRYTREDQEAAEWGLFAMSFRQISEFYRVNYHKMNLPDIARIQQEYWAAFQSRFDAHLTRYADLEAAGARASDYLGALHRWAPGMAEANWWHLLKTGASDANGLLADQPAVRKARSLATEQLAILEVKSGHKPVEMKFTALDGREVDLGALRGKVVLIDFWALWCGPCVAEMPRVKAVYEKYRDRGFEVVGISFDEAPQRDFLEKFLKQQGVTWVQRFEGEGFDADRYKQLYGITELPTVFLLDKQGRLVDRNARGEKLEPLIQRYLSEDPPENL